MSINKITYLNTILPNNLFIFNNSSKINLIFHDYLEIIQFLNELEQDKVYVLTFDFVVSWFSFEEDSPVNESSSPVNESNNNDNILDSQKNFDTQSDTYEQVAVTNIESRMAWSDRATPSIHFQDINSLDQVASLLVHSQQLSPDQTFKPKSSFANLLDSIRARRYDSHVVGSPSNKISNLVDNSQILDDKRYWTFKQKVFSFY
jgi:hypothetical protein